MTLLGCSHARDLTGYGWRQYVYAADRGVWAGIADDLQVGRHGRVVVRFETARGDVLPMQLTIRTESPGLRPLFVVTVWPMPDEDAASVAVRELREIKCLLRALVHGKLANGGAR